MKSYPWGAQVKTSEHKNAWRHFEILAKSICNIFRVFLSFLSCFRISRIHRYSRFQRSTKDNLRSQCFHDLLLPGPNDKDKHLSIFHSFGGYSVFFPNRFISVVHAKKNKSIPRDWVITESLINCFKDGQCIVIIVK